MKTISKITFAVLAMLIVFTACSKTDDDAPDKEDLEENPLTLFFQNAGFDEVINDYPTGAFGEMGFRFKPKVKGNINAVTLRLPTDKTNVLVTIWDVETKAILKTVTLPLLKAHVEGRQDIKPLEISPDKTYLISYYEKSYYERFRTDQSDVPYPIESGNISVLGYHYIYGDAVHQTFPEYTQPNFFYGDVSFVFQQKN